MAVPLDQSSTLSCSECGTTLPADVYQAGQILLGYQGLALSDLVKAIQEEVSLDRYYGGGGNRDRHIGTDAVENWLNGPDYSHLVVAWRHHFGGECERVQNERLAADQTAEVQG